MLGALLAGCGDASVPPTTGSPATTAPAPSTPVPETPAPTPATVATPWTIRAELDSDEELTLGPGVTIRVEWDGGSVAFDDRSSSIDLTGVGPRPEQIALSYPMPERGDDTVAWAQDVAPDADRVVIRQPWRRARPKAPGAIVLGWQAAGGTAAYVDQLAAAPGLTVASPVWWTLEADGSLIDRSDPRLVAAAKPQGIETWPALASLSDDAIRAAVSDPARRSELAAAVVRRAADLGAGGVNLDFEGYRVPQGAAVAAFAEELAERLHAAGMVLSIDVTARSDAWTITPDELDFWSIAPLRRELSAAADYMVLMAYDQFNSYRPAGPVAAPEWVEETLRYQLRYTDPDRLVLGVPFYFRLWNPEALDEPRAISIAAIERFAAEGERRADPQHGVDRVDRADGTFLWLEDAAGLRHRIDFVDAFGLAGLAGWRLGLDGPDVWQVLGGG